MKPIEMPAYRPTASCIWTSFLNSGKRHLILTGGRGTGKSTLLSTLCQEPLPGITTRAKPGQGVYLTEHLSGQTVQIGRFDADLPGPENRMTLLPDGLSSLGIPSLERCIQANSEWVSIDEIGYLETGYPGYRNAVRTLMQKKRLIAVVRKQDIPFLQELRSHPDVFVVDLDSPYGSIGCVIMASGLGMRFGGNKLMADFRGRPLIAHVLDATAGIFDHRVVVTRHRDVAALCHDQGIDVVLHVLPHQSDTVRLGLDALSGHVDSCMFCSGDQPLLYQETVAALALAGANDSTSIWRTVWNSTAGTPVLFPKWTFPELLALPEGCGGSYVIKKYPEQVRMIPVRDMYELKDVDTQEDLSVLLEQ